MRNPLQILKEKMLTFQEMREQRMVTRLKDKAHVIHVDDGATCKNCKEPLAGLYCHVCGQREDELRRPIWTFLQDLIEGVFSSDSRFFKTLFLLILVPGGLTRSYMEGHRARFTPPVRLYIVVSVAFFLIVTLANIAILDIRVTEKEDGAVQALTEQQQEVNIIGDDSPYEIKVSMFVEIDDDERAEIPDAVLRQYTDKIDEDFYVDIEMVKQFMKGFTATLNDPTKFNEIINKWLPRALFFLVPLFALILRIFHWQKEGYYMHQLVFSLHFHAFLFLLLSALLVVVPLWGGAFGMGLFWWGSSLYLVIALWTAQKQGIVRAFLKAGFIWVSYYLILLLAMAQIVFIGLAEL